MILGFNVVHFSHTGKVLEQEPNIQIQRVPVGSWPVSETVGNSDGIVEVKIEHGQVNLYAEARSQVIKMQLSLLRFEFYLLIIFWYE